MWFNITGADVYRQTVSSGFVDPSWSKVATVSGTLTIMGGSERILNNQEFARLKAILTCKETYMEDVQNSDELDIDSVWYSVKTVQKFRNVLPHVEIYLENSQWEE